jgi:hypothetical protein
MKSRIFTACLVLGWAVAAFAQVPSQGPSAVERLAAAIKERGSEAVLKVSEELRGNRAGHEFSEEELSTLGHELLKEGEIEAASAVFKLNVEIFPESWSTYLDLAQACMYSGDKGCAELNFKIALVGSPRNTIAKAVLADLDGRLERVARERQRSFKPGEPTGLKGPYLGQQPPGLTAEIFAPGLVSKALGFNFSSTFSPDGREYYYNHFMTIMVSRLLDEGWTAPEPVTFTGSHRAFEPHITLDGKRLYFGWFRPTPEGCRKLPTPAATNQDIDIYGCERTAEGWSEPECMGHVGFVTTSRDGKIYATDRTNPLRANISQATVENGHFVKLEPLGGGLADLLERFPRTSHPSISPDGRTILFDISMGSGLFAAFRDESGVWSKPVSLSDHGLSPTAAAASYSPDGKYIFFHDRTDIYWISSEFVERLRPEGQ